MTSNPANGAVAVEQDSIVLEFNQPILVDTEDPEWSGFYFFLEPELSVQLDGMSVSDDSTKITIYVELTLDTDYLLGIGGIQGVSGESLDTPYLLQFTTYDQAGEYTITGTVPEGDNGLSVFLSSTSLGFGPYVDEDTTETEDIFPNYGAVIDTTTGEYVISGVRENTYYPVGFNLLQIFEENEFSDSIFFPDIYIYDPDEDFVDDPIEVNASTTTNDTLSGIDLTKLDITSFTFSEAVSRAENFVSNLENDPVLIGGETSYFSFSFFEDEPQFEKRKNTSFTPSKFEIPSFNIKKPGLFKNEKNSFFKASLAEDDSNFLESPDGTNINWELYFYDSIKDSALNITVTPFGNIYGGYLSAEDFDLPEGVQFSDIKPIPDPYIDSDTAVDIFLAEGISDLMTEYSEFDPTEFGGWYFDVTSMHLFWEFEPNSTPAAPVMWIGSFEGYKFNFETEEYSEHWVTIYLDIETGEMLHIEEESFISDDTPISFSDAVALVQDELTEFENDPTIIVGATYYFNEFFFKSKSKQLSPRKQEHRSTPFFTENNVKSKSSTEHESGFQTIPNGYQIEWDVFAYDAVQDSVIYFTVNASGVEYYEFLGTDDSDLPEGYTFADLKPIPNSYIDSDSAAAIIEAKAGEEFRMQFDINNDTEYSSWKMDLTALHYFWEYPDDPTPTAPVMWVGEYYGDYYNYETEESSFGYLIVLLDMETGEVLYSESESDTTTITPLLFSEALDAAYEILSELENRPVLLGGSTYWYYEYEEDDVFKNHPKAAAKITNRAEQRFAKTSSQNSISNSMISSNTDGYQTVWEFYGYDAVKDSAIEISISNGYAEFYGYFGMDEAELPNGVTFSSIMPLPESFIDSDEAVAIMEAEGGADFREKFGVELETEFGYWEMRLDALHSYWEYEPNPTTDAPVMWVGYYYGNTYNFDSEEYTEDSLQIFVDIQTGEVLHKISTSSEVKSELPAQIGLLQNYPNPFNPSTHIPFELNMPSHVKITIYNMLGQKVTTLANDAFSAGSHSINWNASEIASGVYFYRMETPGFAQTRKLMILK